MWTTTRRDEAVIATKVMFRPKGEAYTPGIQRRRILAGCEISLRRLGTDRIDVYYQHFVDADAPNAEAMEALDELVQAGKVPHVACSNVTGARIEERARFADEYKVAPFTAAQIEWNLVNRKVGAEIVPAAPRRGTFGLVHRLRPTPPPQAQSWGQSSRTCADALVVGRDVGAAGIQQRKGQDDDRCHPRPRGVRARAVDAPVELGRLGRAGRGEGLPRPRAGLAG